LGKKLASQEQGLLAEEQGATHESREQLGSRQFGSREQLGSREQFGGRELRESREKLIEGSNSLEAGSNP
jgi:hypothetical protein